MNRESDNPVPTTPQQVNYMQMLPGGICFAHGPYKDTIGCPKWPACATDPQKPEYIAMANAHVPAPAVQEETWMREAAQGIQRRFRHLINPYSPSVQDAIVDILRAHVPASPAAEIDAQFAGMATDEKYQAEAKKLAGEFSSPAADRDAVLEEVCNVIAYWADTHRGETTYGEAKRVLIERVRALKDGARGGAK